MDLILIEKLNQALFHKKYNPESLPGLTETSSSNLTSHHYVIIWFWTFRKQTLYLENSFNFLFNIFEPTSFHDLPSVYQFLARLNLNFYYLMCDCENWKNEWVINNIPATNRPWTIWYIKGKNILSSPKLYFVVWLTLFIDIAICIYFNKWKNFVVLWKLLGLFCSHLTSN